MSLSLLCPERKLLGRAKTYEAMSWLDIFIMPFLA